MSEPTKAEKQIAINAAKKICTIYKSIEVQQYLPHTVSGPVNMRDVWRVILRQGHTKGFESEYEAALYVLKQELMR